MTREKESIAIVGMGCRFPGGASSPEKLWELLLNKQDSIIDIPTDRWDHRRFYNSNTDLKGTISVKQGGFLLEDIKEFDPHFFNIPPREVESMDPQIRMLLEVSWEAFEDAGIQLEQLQGSNTGVYLGVFTLDFYITQLNSLNRSRIGMHGATGGCQTMIPARISYAYDLKGPCLTLDTACSSSLVALHQACQALLNDECEMALSGGVNLMLAPEFMSTISQAHFLSPDCRCRTFDKDGKGYVRGEGAGLVVLKKLSKAVDDGDQIYGLIKGTGVNQDGQTPSIAVPSLDAQKTLIERVLKACSISPEQVNYVEAHGTGTAVGDPIEFNSLSEVLGQNRSTNNHCYVGSIKTNIGHLEGAAGIAGIIKTALVLKHRKIPANLHFNTPNPHLNYEQSFLRVPVETVPLTDSEKPAIACVNSFGFGGTNAHAILEEYQPTPENSETFVETQHSHRLFPFSGKTENAVVDQAKQYLGYLEQNSLSEPPAIENFYYSLTQRRTHHPYRFGVVAESISVLQEKLQDFVTSASQSSVSLEKVLPNHPKLVFVYTGMGPQWWAMGRELFAKEPRFRETIEQCDTAIQKLGGWSLIDELQKDEISSQITATSIAQPANFAIQAALTDLWKSWGVQPDAVMGHSVGELGAAYAAEILDLETGILITYYRSTLQSRVANQGGMLATELSIDEAREYTKQFSTISIGAINSPTSVALSGDLPTLEKVSESLEEKDLFSRFLRVEIAYHSVQMDPLKDEFLKALSEITVQKPRIPIYSTVTGEKAEDLNFGRDYWWDNVREPVDFSGAMNNLVNDDYQLFMEIGPHPVLKSYIDESLKSNKKRGAILSTLNKKRIDEQTMMFEAFAQLHNVGWQVDFRQYSSPSAAFVKLPHYPWQRESYDKNTNVFRQYLLDLGRHVLLTLKNQTPSPSWEVELNENFFPYLNDHQLENITILPGALYVEAGIALHEALFETESCTLENVQFFEALTINPSDNLKLQLQFNKELGEYRVYSCKVDSEEPPVLHAKGSIYEAPAYGENKQYDIPSLQKELGTHRLEKTEIYRKFNALGYHYGQSFQGIEQVWFNQESILAKIEFPQRELRDSRYFLHPTVLDSALQSLIVLVANQRLMVGLSVPTGFSQVSFKKKQVVGPFYAYSTVTTVKSGEIHADIFLLDHLGSTIAELKGCVIKSLTGGIDLDRDEQPYRFYDYQWSLDESRQTQEKAPELQKDQSWILVGQNKKTLKYLQKQLANRAKNITVVTSKKVHRWIEGKSIQKKLSTIEETEGKVNILYLADTDSDTSDIINREIKDSLTLLGLVKLLGDRSIEYSSSLYVITQGLFSPKGTKKVGIAGSGIWGTGRTIMNEYSQITCKLIDLCDEEPDFESLLSELGQGKEFQEVAIRKEGIYHHILGEASLSSESQGDGWITVNTSDRDVSLQVGVAGDLDSLSYQLIQATLPEEGEVTVKVDSASLNFKDLLKIMNLLPAAAKEGTFFQNRIGMEYSGRITHIGKSVEGFKIGDEICFVSPAPSFQSVINVPEGYIMRRLPGCSMEETPSYTNFATIIRTLKQLAQLQKDEYVLIHGASGGIGLAAIQYAQHKGAKIIATVGSDRKREFVRNLGVEYIADSRSLGFRDEIMEWTEGHGVDVVLNFLSDDFFKHSLSALAPFGRFMEIGKKDIASDRYLPLEIFNRNIMFASFDLDQTIAQNMKLMNHLCDEVYSYFERGIFKPLPTRVFPASEITSAFKLMSLSQHIGKISVRFRDEEVTVPDITEKKSVIQGDGSYLITGGMSGFGLEIAEWLVEKGAKNLVLIGRSGIPDELTRGRITQLKERADTILIRAVDVTNFPDMKRLFSEIETDLPPLKGILHCAMVLDDCLIEDCSDEQFKKVFVPKAEGAWHLHQLSEKLPLEFFVLMSSVSSLIGNAGQVNYVAGNSFLDRLAHYRQSRGLQATTINLGALKETGVIARNVKHSEHLEQMGVYGLRTTEALSALELVIQKLPTQVGILNINWQKLSESTPGLEKSKRFASLIAKNREKGSSLLVEKLSGIPVDEQEDIIISNLKLMINKVAGIKEDTLDIHQSLLDLGIDSLMSVELQSKIHQEYGVRLSIMELVKGPPLFQIVQKILQQYKETIAEQEEAMVE